MCFDIKTKQTDNYMIKLSAFIITKNEEHRVAKAINSVKDIADEVIVIDSGSTDNTVMVAKNLGVQVVFNEWPGYVKQKSFGENLCKNDWVLNIDADEELTKELQEEIKQVFSSDNYDKYKAYEINFITLHRNDKNDKKPRFLAPSNPFIRIYNRKFCSFSNTKNTTTHDRVTFNEDIKPQDAGIFKFKKPGYHRSATSIEQLINKGNFYSTEQAKDMIDLGRRISCLRIIFELPFIFFKSLYNTPLLCFRF